MKLTGQQYQQLSEALRDAFPLRRLREMLRFKLEKRLDDISLAEDYQGIVFDLIRAAEAEGWTDRLITAARESNSGNALLVDFSQQFGLAPATPPRAELERIIKKTSGFLDVVKWRERLGAIETQVCRIEIEADAGTIYGTGFLLGPSLVMTNYHVIEALTTQEAKPSDVTLRFDYKRLVDGKTLNPGTEYHLVEDKNEWLVDSSPPSPVDDEAEPKSKVPQPDQLDYALLRVDGEPGNKPVGENADPESPPRKWIELPAKAYKFQPDNPIFIMQHPQGEPLKLAFDDTIGLNDNGTRVKYKVSTEGGSSGSPCFNSNWELVALHHSGDPNFDTAHKPTYNEGIPFAAIRALLKERGKEDLLGDKQ
jgi:hypothetical protein